MRQQQRGAQQQQCRRHDAEPRQPAGRGTEYRAKTCVRRQASEMVGKQRAAPYALPLAEPGARQPRHAVGDLPQHERPHIGTQCIVLPAIPARNRPSNRPPANGAPPHSAVRMSPPRLTGPTQARSRGI